MVRTSLKGRGRIVVIGTSSGGLEALSSLLKQLPSDFPAPILVVQHLSPDTNGSVLLEVIQRNTSLNCKLAQDGDRIQSGHLLIAPPDHHMLLKKGHVLVTKGARENRYRPAIDPTFRSAAVAYGHCVIGIILTGGLDDGTAGLKAIQSCAGICVVQDPTTSLYPDMAQSALDNMKVDFCLPLNEIGSVLHRLVSRRVPRR